MSSEREATTRLLTAHASGEARAADELLPLVYRELRQLAAGYLRRERSAHTLQPTALVHEAYLALVNHDRIDWQGKTHFLAMAATQMRRILVDHARATGSEKRGGRLKRVTLTVGVVGGTAETSTELLALDEALDRLAQDRPRQSRVAELRLFGGLGARESALALDVSERTARDDWRLARAWLMKELSPSRPPQ